MSPAQLLRSQRHALAMMIVANDTARVDRPTRVILDGLSDQARRRIARIDRDMPCADWMMGLHGENGSAPGIRDLIEQSKRQREMGAVLERKVA